MTKENKDSKDSKENKSLIMSDTNTKGIVFTPPYVANLIAQILQRTDHTRVLDICAGNGALLEPCNELNMQIMGIEIQPELISIAKENIRPHIINADCFAISDKIKEFAPNAIILNPPYTRQNKGMEFGEFALNQAEHGIGILLVPQNVCNGGTKDINKHILEKHTLSMVIDMPSDLFMPHAAVKTCILIFDMGIPHNTNTSVKFIDFSNDGYKRTKRKSGNLQDVDDTETKYALLPKLFTLSKDSKNNKDIISEISEVINHKTWQGRQSDMFWDGRISLNGDDWNGSRYKIIDTRPKYEDFYKTAKQFIEWELSEI